MKEGTIKDVGLSHDKLLQLLETIEKEDLAQLKLFGLTVFLCG